jgi:soluble lytic murein transglycosylase-like protein
VGVTRPAPRQRKRFATQLSVAALVALALPATARAELYSYTTEDGVVHFTNVAPRRAQQVPEAKNTYLWEGEAGVVQRLHRVDINAFDPIIMAAATYYALPPALVKAVVAVESNFEPRAVSHAGALGLMQLLPSTASQMYVDDCFDATDNIYGGTRYLRVLANRFGGDLRLTIAAYNAGPEVVERVNGVPNIAETQSYVRRVLVLYRHYLTAWKAKN